MPWFKKEIPERPIYLPNGMPLNFTPVSDGFGYLETNNGYEFTELRKAITQGRGGVTEIGEAEYQEFLKKKAEMPLWQPPRQRPTIGPVSHNNQLFPGSAAAADTSVPANANMVGVMADGRTIGSFAQPQKTEGLQVPKTFVKPRVGKIGVE